MSVVCLGQLSSAAAPQPEIVTLFSTRHPSLDIMQLTVMASSQ